MVCGSWKILLSLITWVWSYHNQLGAISGELLTLYKILDLLWYAWNLAQVMNEVHSVPTYHANRLTIQWLRVSLLDLPCLLIFSEMKDVLYMPLFVWQGFMEKVMFIMVTLRNCSQLEWGTLECSHLLRTDLLSECVYYIRR